MLQIQIYFRIDVHIKSTELFILARELH